MLIAMAITLVMVGAVVTLFANISNSVRNRRAVVEMSGQLRHARNMLQQDLQGATCPGLPWQRPDENQGYIEIIEGPLSDRNPSAMLRDTNDDGVVDVADFDVSLSILPRNNAVPDVNNNGRTDAAETEQYNKLPQSLSPGGIGDHDDILMLTVRNEHEPFVGRVPKNDGSSSAVRTNITNALAFTSWEHTSLESPLAEVVWYAIENPGQDPDGNDEDAEGFYGEPGMRTIYRRTLLIAPWINPYRFTAADGTFTDTFRIPNDGSTFTAQPGLVRVLPDDIEPDHVAQAIACLIAFQERFDLSVRLEFDPLLGSSSGRWKIVANTLGDLTKRENRYEHHFYRPQAFGGRVVGREYPYAAISTGSDYRGITVRFVLDPEVQGVAPIGTNAQARTVLGNSSGIDDMVRTYTVVPDSYALNNSRYAVRPFAYVDEDSGTLATARAALNDQGEVVRVTHGFVPLSGDRRGEDVMLSDALGFDLRVYDPGAPLYGVREIPTSSTEPVGTILSPTDSAWRGAYSADIPVVPSATDYVGDATIAPMVGQGAFVDLGYGFQLGRPQFPPGSSAVSPWFFTAKALSDVYIESRTTLADAANSQLAPGYAVFDTWSFHYENNGVNEDRLRYDGSNWLAVDNLVDEGTNGLDDVGSYSDGYVENLTVSPFNPRLGPDDVGERETAPPYNKPLRGLQVLLRLYERDSRQVRQVSVNQHFVPE